MNASTRLHKWLLAAVLAFIMTVCYAYQDEVRACLVGIPACHMTIIHKDPAKGGEP